MGADRRQAIALGAGAVAFGQALLVLLSPLSRASSPGVEASGIALLSADSFGYLDLAAGDGWLSATPWNRALYIALLRLGGHLGDAATFIVVLQVLALVAAAALASRMADEVGGRAAGTIAALVIGANPLIAQWVRFVLTETLFVAIVIIALWSARLVLRGTPDLHPGVVLLLSGLLALLMRPNGILVLGSAATIIALRPGGRAPRLIVLPAIWIGVAVGLGVGLAAAGQPAERSLTEQLQGGIVVEGTEHVVTSIMMPPARDPEDVSLRAGITYALSHPLATARLTTTRIVVESVQVRRHYPATINLAVGLAMALLFVAAAAGARGDDASRLRRAVAVLGIPLALMIGATFATPEGRYGWGYLALLAPLAGIGASGVLSVLLRPVRTIRAQRAAGPGPGIAR